MKYMMLIYRDEQDAEAQTPEHRQQTISAAWDVIEEAKRRGVLVGVSPLEPTSSATTIRRKDGKVLVSDGPFAESKEQLAGYYILECKDLDEAIGIAARIPGARMGTIEVRPVAQMPVAGKKLYGLQ